MLDTIKTEQGASRMNRIDHLQKQISDLLCNHPQKEIRYKSASNDVKMYKSQCVRCGELLGEWIPHSNVGDKTTIKPIDHLLPEIYQDNIHDLEKALRDRIRLEKKDDFDVWYADYLLSNRWRDKRRLVFNRCKDVCEGCGYKKATIVHHLNYDHVGNEFLFELVGVCSDCHDRLHPQHKEETYEYQSEAVSPL